MSLKDIYYVCKYFTLKIKPHVKMVIEFIDKTVVTECNFLIRTTGISKMLCIRVFASHCQITLFTRFYMHEKSD